MIEDEQGAGASAGPTGAINAAMIPDMVDALVNFPANGKPPLSDAIVALTILGFIERQEITKSCRECGTKRPDYHYMKITPAGRYFLAAAQGARP